MEDGSFSVMSIKNWIKLGTAVAVVVAGLSLPGLSQPQPSPQATCQANLLRVQQEPYAMAQEAAAKIRAQVKVKPEVAIILGSGLGDLVDLLQDKQVIPYKDIPGFAISTAEGHAGLLVFGRLEGRDVVIMQGRVHCYEGYDVRNVAFPVRVMKLLGVKTLIVTNASGAVSPGHHLGELVLIKDHINMLGVNPLVGLNEAKFGPRFFDMNSAYTEKLRKLALQEAEKLNINLREGVYAAMSGPSYETPAERGMLRNMGADVVGMSTVPEVIVAVHCGLQVLGISCVTDVPADIPTSAPVGLEDNEQADQPAIEKQDSLAPNSQAEQPKAATHEAVLQTAEQAEQNLGRLLKAVVGSL